MAHQKKVSSWRSASTSRAVNFSATMAPVLEEAGQGVGIEHVTSAPSEKRRKSSFLSLAFAFALREHFSNMEGSPAPASGNP